MQKDLNSWNLARVVWVMDRGMSSQANQRILQRAGGRFIMGEKLSGNHLNEVALAQPGRFKVISDNLHIKEVLAGEGTGRRRCVVACNRSRPWWTASSPPFAHSMGPRLFSRSPNPGQPWRGDAPFCGDDNIDRHTR